MLMLKWPRGIPRGLKRVLLVWELISHDYLSEWYELDSLVNHTRVRTVLHGIDNQVSVILGDACIDVQSLHGLIKAQREITLERPLVSEWHSLAKLRPGALLQAPVEDYVWALLHLGSFELIHEG